MTTAALSPSRLPRTVAVCLLALLLTACTGRGGGQLPPDEFHTGAASFGFSVSCEDKGGLNPQTGKLHIQLSYTERGTTQVPLQPAPLLGSPLPLSPFSIHGVVDEVDPVVESMLCSGREPFRTPGELIFLGRYRVTSTSEGFPAECSRELSASSCRFEVIVRDADADRAPSPGDSFSVRLSTAPDVTSDLHVDEVFYVRAGVLSSGNLTVD